MRMSDLVAKYITEMLDEQNGSAEIQRNELAGNLGCVPSQINYVITSRFTPEQGYIVESRRGGGGYIRISRVSMDRGTAIMHIINSVAIRLTKLLPRQCLTIWSTGRLFNLALQRLWRLRCRTERFIQSSRKKEIRSELIFLRICF